MAKSPNRPNFGTLLDKRPDEVEKPKPMPEGSYLWTVQGTPRMDKSSKKQTEFVEFTLKCMAAGGDVDAEALKETLTSYGPDGKVLSVKKITDLTQRATYYLTDGSLWRLKEFLEHCDIDVDSFDSLRMAIEETPNASVGAFINHEPSQDGQNMFARIGKTFKAEDFENDGEEADEIEDEDEEDEAEEQPKPRRKA